MTPVGEPVNYRQLVEAVTDLLEGALPVDVHASVEEHLAVCPACVRYLGQMRTTIRALAAVDEEADVRLAEPARAQLLAAFRSWRGG